MLELRKNLHVRSIDAAGAGRGNGAIRSGRPDDAHCNARYGLRMSAIASTNSSGMKSLPKYGCPIVLQGDRVVTRRDHEPDPTCSQSFRHRHRRTVKELHVQYGAVDGFLFDERESLDGGSGRPYHESAGRA